MTGIAIRNKLRLLDLVFLHKLAPKGKLIGWFLVVGVEHVGPSPVLLARIVRAVTNMQGRILVAIYTPAHVQRVGAIGEWHFANRSMASGAADSFIDVNTVIKVDEIRLRVHPRPLQRNI